MKKSNKLLEKKYLIPISAIILALVMVGIYRNIYQPTKDIAPPDYIQAEDQCKAGGAELKLFNTGCHDECGVIRSKEPVFCTQALSYGCDCGLDKCWNGSSCEFN